MKVTNEERIIIKFLKKERDEAKVWEMEERERLIKKLKKRPCEESDFVEYIDAHANWLAFEGTYGGFVDNIRMRIIEAIDSR